MNLFRHIEADYRRIARDGLPDEWCIDLATLDDVVEAIRDHREHQERSDDLTRRVATIARTDQRAAVVVLYALAPLLGAIRERLAAHGHPPVYLSLDIDCLDPAFAPGTGTPVPGGLSSAQALEIIRGMGPVNLVGMDVVEVSPPFDQSELTALAAAHVATDLLCVLRNQKLGKV